jgi:hypothetical protein
MSTHKHAENGFSDKTTSEQHNFYWFGHLVRTAPFKIDSSHANRQHQRNLSDPHGRNRDLGNSVRLLRSCTVRCDSDTATNQSLTLTLIKNGYSSYRGWG